MTTETEDDQCTVVKADMIRDNNINFVHIGNHNWNLVLYMLFGIRQSVMVSKYDDDVFQLSQLDFTKKVNYPLD